MATAGGAMIMGAFFVVLLHETWKRRESSGTEHRRSADRAWRGVQKCTEHDGGGWGRGGRAPGV